MGCVRGDETVKLISVDDRGDEEEEDFDLGQENADINPTSHGSEQFLSVSVFLFF